MPGPSVVNCPDPLVSNTTRNLTNGLQQGSAVHYTCNNGFVHSSGDLIRTCTSSGTWNGMAPICTRMYILVDVLYIITCFICKQLFNYPKIMLKTYYLFVWIDTMAKTMTILSYRTLHYIQFYLNNQYCDARQTILVYIIDWW